MPYLQGDDIKTRKEATTDRRVQVLQREAVPQREDTVALFDASQQPGAFEMVMSRKGKPMIKIGGYSYKSVPSNTPKTRWVCSTHHNQGCRANVITFDSEIIKSNTKHTHDFNKTVNYYTPGKF
ncbi:uncharacterized protein LOC114355042 [Ostrinia furnacalis]|uniref:uncharacterized protein LOC114355042 n=1 Tax=Ostrinia furnacalis TaxID=93504 RepID=UPI001040371C|nr:uncharacterized protein LOC114355042 [Ostrinia furnacalis]